MHLSGSGLSLRCPRDVAQGAQGSQMACALDRPPMTTSARRGSSCSKRSSRTAPSGPPSVSRACTNPTSPRCTECRACPFPPPCSPTMSLFEPVFWYSGPSGHLFVSAHIRGADACQADAHSSMACIPPSYKYHRQARGPNSEKSCTLCGVPLPFPSLPFPSLPFPSLPFPSLTVPLLQPKGTFWPTDRYPRRSRSAHGKAAPRTHALQPPCTVPCSPPAPCPAAPNTERATQHGHAPVSTAAGSTMTGQAW